MLLTKFWSQPHHGRRQGEAGEGHAPLDFHTLLLNLPIFKNFSFLEVNTGFILIAPPPEKFSADALKPHALTSYCIKKKQQHNSANVKASPHGYLIIA